MTVSLYDITIDQILWSVPNNWMDLNNNHRINYIYTLFLAKLVFKAN